MTYGITHTTSMRCRITSASLPDWSANLPKCAIESPQQFYLNARWIYLQVTLKSTHTWSWFLGAPHQTPPRVHIPDFGFWVPHIRHAILHSRHPADCILPILVSELAVGVFPATAIPNRLLLCHGIFWSFRYFPSINLPASCLSMKSATHVP